MELINMTLEEQVVNRLIEREYHISFAESCTGGLCCGTLVNVPNASAVLDESYVTYANDSKIKLLGVSVDTIDSYGVVSEQVAREMAMGVSKSSGAEVGVGITGVAGPTGGTDKKPVGMVCFGFSVNNKVSSYTMQFGNLGRNTVRSESVKFTLETLLDLL